MVRALLVLVILGLFLLLGYSVQNLQMFVRIYNHADHSYIETPFIAWILLSFFASYLLLLALKVLHLIWRSPQIFGKNARERKSKRANKLLQQGLRDMALGNYAMAEKRLAQGGKLAEELGLSPVLYYENAALAAEKQNSQDRRDRYFLKAREKSSRVSDGLLTKLSEAKSLFESGELQAAANILEALKGKDNQQNIKIVQLLDEVYPAQKRYLDAWENVQHLKRHLSQDVFHAKRREYAKGLLKDNSSANFEAVKEAWQKLPAEIKYDKELVVIYAATLVDNSHSDEAEKLLMERIVADKDLDLIQAYSQLRGVDYQVSLENMLSWQPEFNDNALFLYCLALVAYRAKDYSIALNSIERSLKLRQSPESFALLAQILEAQQQPQAALTAYRRSVVAQLQNDKALSGELLPDRKSVV